MAVRTGTGVALAAAVVAGAVLAAVGATGRGSVAAEGARESGLPALDCAPPPGWAYPQASPPDPERPPEVLSWRHRILEPEEYEGLARQWEAYAAGHPHDARALVEWGDALRYAGSQEEGVARYARAFAVDSSDAAAAAAHCFQFMHGEDERVWRRAHRTLLEAAGGDPLCADVYYPLWATSLRSGDEALAAECLRRVVALGDMPRPLLDWGHNMIAGAPAGAVIFTNGDNDTYPPLAYQALTGDRTDVAIVNLSLLNTLWYIRHWRDRDALITLSDREIAALRHRHDARIADQLQQHMVANARRSGRPLFYCVTVYKENIATDAPLVVEGLLLRVSTGRGPGGEAPRHDLERTRELLDTVYLLDGARDPFIDWDREQAVASLCLNYAALLGEVGTWLLDTQRAGEAGPYLYRAVEMSAARGAPEKGRELIRAWEQRNPREPLLVRARELLHGSGAAPRP